MKLTKPALTAYWITGPSGAGKSEVGAIIRADEKLKLASHFFDADFVGYRTDPNDWKQWTIPLGVFALCADVALRTLRPYFLAGVSGDANGMREAALAVGFQPIVLLPSVAVIAAQRRKRKDSAEKIAESPESFAAWSNLALKWEAPVYDSAQQIVDVLVKGKLA